MGCGRTVKRVQARNPRPLIAACRRGAIEHTGTPPLAVCVHGYPDTAKTWFDFMPQLAADGYRVVAPHLRGYHPSSAPAGTCEALAVPAVWFVVSPPLHAQATTMGRSRWAATCVPW